MNARLMTEMRTTAQSTTSANRYTSQRDLSPRLGAAAVR